MSGSTSANDAADPQMAAIRRRRAMAQMLMQQSQSQEVIRSPWQGLARVLQAVGGGATDYMAGREEDRLNTDRRAGANQFMAALLGGQGGPAPVGAEGGAPAPRAAPMAPPVAAQAPNVSPPAVTAPPGQGPTDAEVLAASRLRLASISGRPPEGVPTGRAPENAGATIPNTDFNPNLPESPANPRVVENPWHGARGQIPASNGQLFSAPGAPAAPTLPQALMAPSGAPVASPMPRAAPSSVPDPNRLMAAYAAAANSDNPLIRNQAPQLLQMAQFGSLQQRSERDDVRGDRAEARQAEQFRQQMEMQRLQFAASQGNQQAQLELARRTAALAEDAARFRGLPQGFEPAPGGGARPIAGVPVQPPPGTPSGYRAGAGGALEPIPGGPADPGRNGGPFQGTGLDAQSTNILLTRDPSTPEYAAAYAQLSAPRVNTDGSSVTPNMQPYRAPTYRPPGTAEGAPAPDYSRPNVTEPTRPTADQGRVATYVTRMLEADRIIANPEIAASAQSLSNRAANAIPLVGNYLTGSSFQQMSQAQRNFINATLRRESGAVIGADEFANAQQQYFPQPGDGPEVLAQKAANRQSTIAGMSREAGPAAPAQAAPAAQSGWSIRPVQ